MPFFIRVTSDDELWSTIGNCCTCVLSTRIDRSLLRARRVIACVQLRNVFHIGCYFLWAFVYEKKKTEKGQRKSQWKQTRLSRRRVINNLQLDEITGKQLFNQYINVTIKNLNSSFSYYITLLLTTKLLYEFISYQVKN